jgi:hypothetical protein
MVFFFRVILVVIAALALFGALILWEVQVLEKREEVKKYKSKCYLKYYDAGFEDLDKFCEAKYFSGEKL